MANFSSVEVDSFSKFNKKYFWEVNYRDLNMNSDRAILTQRDNLKCTVLLIILLYFYIYALILTDKKTKNNRFRKFSVGQFLFDK